MKVRLTRWTENKDSVSVHRGPLTYSLKIGEKYVRVGGTDRWPALEVHPTTDWNYGLVVDEVQPLARLLTGNIAIARSVAFSPDGRTLASGSGDGILTLWDISTRQPLGRLHDGHTAEVLGVAFSPDGKTLASSSGDGTLVLWDLGLESWVARACRTANRNLTQEEWDLFIGSDIPYECTCPNLPLGEGAPPDACADTD